MTAQTVRKPILVQFVIYNNMKCDIETTEFRLHSEETAGVPQENLKKNRCWNHHNVISNIFNQTRETL